MDSFISGMLVGTFVGVILMITLNVNRSIYINTPNKDSCCDNFSPWFQVVEIVHRMDAKGKSIARYCIETRFFNKENNRDYTVERLYFYDDVNKYKINDIIRLYKEVEP